MLVKPATTTAIVFLILVIVIASPLHRNVVDAITAPSRCLRMTEAALQPKWCDSSACLNTNTKDLCSIRGACIGGGLCTDCSWTAQGVTSASDCSLNSPYGTPGTIPAQLDQLSRQLNLAVIVLKPARYLPRTMDSFDQHVEEFVSRRGQSGVEDYFGPTQLVFLDEPNSTNSGITFGVASPILGYVPEIVNENQISLQNCPLYNYYIEPLPLVSQNVDYSTLLEYGDMNVGDVQTAVQITFQKSDLDYYQLNRNYAQRRDLYAKEMIPNDVEGDSPYEYSYRPFVKQTAFFRSTRSNNMTRAVVNYTSTLR